MKNNEIKKSKFVRTFIDCIKIKFGQRIPIKVGHLITYRCNLNCSFCYNKTQRGKNKEMNLEQIKSMMAEFAKMGTQIWKIGGGEPLLRPDLQEIIHHGKKLGFVMNIDTNGTLVKQNIEKLKELNNVSISLDGPKDIHDKIRGKGVFDKVDEAIDLLHKIRIKTHLTTVICKENINYIEELVDYAKKKNCYIRLQPVVPINEEAKKETAKDLIKKEVFKRILKLKKDYNHIANSEFDLKRMEKYYEGEINHYQKKCLAGKMYCVISPEGNISPCLFRLTQKWPNGTETSFSEAFKNLKIKYNCDCIFDAYYNMSRLYSLNPRMLLKATRNLKKGRWIYS